MRSSVLRAYSYFNAGRGPTKEQRSQKMYLEYDLGWSRERATQIRTEVEHNRLEARLAKARLAEEVRPPAEEALRTRSRGMFVRGTAAVMALFR